MPPSYECVLRKKVCLIRETAAELSTYIGREMHGCTYGKKRIVVASGKSQMAANNYELSQRFHFRLG